MHDRHETHLISALIAINAISCPQVSLSRSCCAIFFSGSVYPRALPLRLCRKSYPKWACCSLEYRRRHLVLSPLLDLLDGTHLMQSHLRPRPLSARNAGVLRARACGSRKRRWRQIRVSIAFVRSCPSAYKWGESGHQSSHPPSQQDIQVRSRSSTTSQQRCLTPCSPCASWDSLRSPLPATSRTAPEEGSGRCQRLGSDRWGPLSFLGNHLSLMFNFYLISFGSLVSGNLPKLSVSLFWYCIK